MTSQQMNQGMMNRLLSVPKEQWPKANKRFNNPGISKQMEEMVEIERQRRFEMIMDIPPFKFLVLVSRKALPWM